MDNFTWIYGLPFRCMMRDNCLVENKEILHNDRHGFLVKTKIQIIIIDATLSIRDFLQKTMFREFLNPVVKLCKFYVCSDEEISKQLSYVSDEIVRMSADYKDKWMNFNKMSISLKYSIKNRYLNKFLAIDLVPRIYLHFGHYTDYENKYIFINSTTSNGTVETNDDCIEYVHIDKRNKCAPILHGKINSDNTVDTFDYFPLTDIPKVYILREGWHIPTKHTNNKIAIRICGNMVFWLLTTNHSFISHHEYMDMEGNPPSCSSIEVVKLTMDQIKFICTIFKEVGGFANIIFKENCIYSTDVQNNLFMFIGIMQEDIMGVYASLFNAYE